MACDCKRVGMVDLLTSKECNIYAKSKVSGLICVSLSAFGHVCSKVMEPSQWQVGMETSNSLRN